jgi:hypothetical protein
MPQIIKKHRSKMFAIGFMAGLLVFAVMAFNVEYPRNGAPTSPFGSRASQIFRIRPSI